MWKNPKNWWKKLIWKEKIFISSERIEKFQWHFQKQPQKNKVSTSLKNSFLETSHGGGQTECSRDFSVKFTIAPPKMYLQQSADNYPIGYIDLSTYQFIFEKPCLLRVIVISICSYRPAKTKKLLELDVGNRGMGGVGGVGALRLLKKLLVSWLGRSFN